ncbi:MAG: PAS domain S-box protein [Deltaproteobacteria bacterium]|nr:PAS domain S-box protein [Deltaproteobacteria bacterium]
MGDTIPFPSRNRGQGEAHASEVPLLAVPRIARICALGLGLDELLEEVCREILSLCGAEGCYLVSCRDHASRIEIWRSVIPGDWPDLGGLYRREVRLGEAVERLRSEGGQAFGDLELLPPEHPFRLLNDPSQVRSAMLFPLRYGSRILGILVLHAYSGKKSWNEGERRVIEDVVAPILSAALERRRMEEELRDSEARYRFLADHALDFISLHDPEGKYLYASPAAGRMLGYRQEEMIGVPAAVFLHPDDREKFLEENRRIADKDSSAVTLHCRLRRKDGGYLEVETVASAVRDEAGEIRMILRITRDITERKRIENHLFESQKLETLGMLAGGVAHEFNNLLLGITGAVELLRLMLAGNVDAGKYLDMIERNGERAVELTGQLLAYARKGKYSPQVLPLNWAVDEAVPILKAAFPPSVEFRLDLAEDLPPVLADAAQLKQVVMSLCLNAGEAMPGGGALSIRTRREERQAARSGSGGDSHPVRFAVLEVGDTGCGMDEKTLARIFEPFFSTKFIGRGMGLAAVRGIVEIHDGEISVRSLPGKGTTFTIALPAAPETPAYGEEREDPADGRNGTILVADDEDDVREVVSAMLRSFGYRVIEARNGVEAVELFRERHREIALVLLDLMMPWMNGDRAFSEMRRICPWVRALLASGYDESERIREIVAEGFQGFLQKPFRRAELGRKVEEVLGGRGRGDDPLIRK